MLGLAKREIIIPPILGFFILIFVFFLVYQPWFLGEREFFRLEGFYATQTVEMDSPPLATAHGVAIKNAYPLLPLLASFISKHVDYLPLEFILRSISVLAMAFTAILVYITTRAARSNTAAQIATLMFITINVVAEKSIDAYPQTLMMFGLLSAHLTWFYFGVRRTNWNLAWLLSLAIMVPTFYAGGFEVLLYYFIPLVFMRRPLTVWSKLRRPGFWMGMVLLIGGIVCWAIPYWFLSRKIPMQTLSWGPSSFASYFKDLCSFPKDILFRFFPWVLIAWGPFCVALQNQDETPILGRFFRTLFFPTFFLLWLFPGVESRDFIYLAAPLSILTGMYYEQTIRRYSFFFKHAMKCCALLTIGVSFGIAFFALLPESVLAKFVDFSKPILFKQNIQYVAIAMVIAIVVYLMAIFIYNTIEKRRPVYISILFTALSFCAFFWVVMFPYQSQIENKKELAALMRDSLIKSGANVDYNLTIYKSGILDLYNECYYIGANVKKIKGLDELPKSTKVVYLLSTEFPQTTNRNWTRLLPPDLIYLRHRLCLWRGELRQSSLLKTEPTGELW